MGSTGKDLAAASQATIERLGLAGELAARYHPSDGVVRVGGVGATRADGPLEYGVDYRATAESLGRIVDDLAYYARRRARSYGDVRSAGDGFVIPEAS